MTSVFQGGLKLISQRWVLGILVISGTISAVTLVRLQSITASSSFEEEIIFPEIRTVTALGRLEPEGEAIQLSATTSNEGSRVSQLLATEGETVQMGQVIAILDSRDRFQADLFEAQERLNIAQIQLEQTLAGAKQGEIDAQRAEIARLEAQRQGDIMAQQATIARMEAEVANAEDEYKRYQELYEAGAISASEQDSKRLVLQTAQRSLEEAEAVLTRLQTTRLPELEAAKANLERIQEIRPVDVRAATAEVGRAQAAVNQALARLDQAYVKAPQAGTILNIYSRPGETIASEGIVELGHIDQMVAIAEIYDSDIHKVKVGQPATISSTSLPGQTLQGTVESIGLRLNNKPWLTKIPLLTLTPKL